MSDSTPVAVVVMPATLLMDASLPDGSRQPIAVPFGCIPRVGEYVQLEGQSTPIGTPQLFKVEAVFYELGGSLGGFKPLLFVDPVPTRPGLRLVPIPPASNNA